MGCPAERGHPFFSLPVKGLLPINKLILSLTASIFLPARKTHRSNSCQAPSTLTCFLSPGKNELNTKKGILKWREEMPETALGKCADDLPEETPLTRSSRFSSPGAASLLGCTRQRSQLPPHHFVITAKLLCVFSDH